MAYDIEVSRLDSPEANKLLHALANGATIRRIGTNGVLEPMNREGILRNILNGCTFKFRVIDRIMYDGFFMKNPVAAPVFKPEEGQTLYFECGVMDTGDAPRVDSFVYNVNERTANQRALVRNGKCYGSREEVDHAFLFFKKITDNTIIVKDH